MNPLAEETSKLLAEVEIAHAEMMAVVDQLLYPRRLALLPEYQKMIDAVKALKLDYDQKCSALREHRLINSGSQT